MLKDEMRKLSRRFLVLAVLVGCLAFLTSGPSVYAYGEADRCDAAYDNCNAGCFGSSVCYFFCYYNWSNCSREEQPEGPPQV